MLVMFAMDVGIHVFFGLVTGRWLIVLSNVPLQLVMLIGVNLIVASRLYGPIAAYLSGTGDQVQAFLRIQQLPRLSTIAAVLIVVPTITVNVIVIPQVFFRDDLALIPLATIITRVVIWFVVMPYFIYFLVVNFTAELRAALFRVRKVIVPAREGYLLRRLVVAFCVAALLPGSVMFVDSLGLEALAETVGIEPYLILGSDLLASVMIFAVTFPVIARTFQRPLGRLADAVTALRAGDLQAKAPVMTDDELGYLAQTYNDMVDGLHERERVREAFGRFVNPRVAKTILEHPERLDGEVSEATVLFTDIERFTTITENMSPQATIALLNQYFEVVMEPITRHGGVITNFTGDSLLAAFNVPEPDPDHAANAVRTALEIQRLVDNRTFGDGLIMRTRIGINTGQVVAGAVGGSDRLGYTIIGDSVNLAARLEQLNKQFDTLIMVSEETKARAGNGFSFEPLGELTVKGRERPVHAFAVSTN